MLQFIHMKEERVRINVALSEHMKIKNGTIEFTNKTVALKTDQEWNHTILYLISMLCTEMSFALRQLNSVDETGFELTLADGSSTSLSIINLAEGQVAIRIGSESVEQANLQILVTEFLEHTRANLDKLLNCYENDVCCAATRNDILEYLQELEVCLNVPSPDPVSCS